MASENTQEHLEKLRLITAAARKRQYVTPGNVDKTTWKCVELPVAENSALIEQFSSNLITNYVQRLEWANENCKGRYSRSLNAFWFEDPKDAFVFRLTWGEK